MYKIMIYIENSELTDGINLLSAAEIIKRKKRNVEIYAVGFNLETSILKNKFDKIINIIIDTNKYNIKNNNKIISEICKSEDFKYILFNASDLGRMIAPRLAISLNSGIVADVTEIQDNLEEIIMIRPAYEGKMFAAIQTKKNEKVVMTIRSGIYRYNDSPIKDAFIQNIEIEENKESDVKIIDIKKKEISVDIREADFLISYGGWVTKEAQVNKVRELGKTFGAQIASSKRPVDEELSIREIQVGHSGKIVSPKTYIAIGISGAIQHIEGLKNIDLIVSINKDSDAALNSLANIVIVGDAEDIMEKIEKALKK